MQPLDAKKTPKPYALQYLGAALIARCVDPARLRPRGWSYHIRRVPLLLCSSTSPLLSVSAARADNDRPDNTDYRVEIFFASGENGTLYPSGRHADEYTSEDAPTRIMNLPPFPPRQKSVPIDDEIFDRVAEELRERPDLEEEAYRMRTAPNYDQTTRHEMMWQAAEARLQQHHDWAGALWQWQPRLPSGVGWVGA